MRAVTAGTGGVRDRQQKYSQADRATMEDNVEHFGLSNISIIDHVDEENMKDLPVPSTVFMVASASMDQELAYLTSINPS